MWLRHVDKSELFYFIIFIFQEGWMDTCLHDNLKGRSWSRFGGEMKTGFTSSSSPSFPPSLSSSCLSSLFSSLCNMLNNMFYNMLWHILYSISFNIMTLFLNKLQPYSWQLFLLQYCSNTLKVSDFSKSWLMPQTPLHVREIICLWRQGPFSHSRYINP